jgi:hypothetical protein
MFRSFFTLCWRLKNDTYLPSTNSPKLILCSSLRKDKLSDGSGVATMLSCLKSTHAFKQELSSELEWTILTFKVTHITFHHGACSRLLGLEQLKDRTVRSSQVPCFKLFDQLLFQSFFCKIFKIKLRDSYVWPSQVSYLWYFWILTKTFMVYAFSLLQDMW